MLMNHNWPGNVRELQNAIQFALAKCQGRTIEPSHLPKKLRSAATEPFTVQHRRPKLQVRDVIRALGKVNGNKNKAAELLGVSRSTLYRFFAKLEDGNTP
jgi:transcriptional regulator of acetoin/glycerol metabolism